VRLLQPHQQQLSQSHLASAAGTPSSLVKLSNLHICQVKIIYFAGLISTFLHVHPFGAGIDYIWSYLQKVEPNLRPPEVEALMNRFPSVFRQELSGIGANMERKWIFAGFSRPE
jgi:hypothetical protein